MTIDFRVQWVVGIPKIRIAHGSETSGKSMRVLTVFLVGGLKLEKAYQPYYKWYLRNRAFDEEETCLSRCGFVFCSFSSGSSLFSLFCSIYMQLLLKLRFCRIEICLCTKRLSSQSLLSLSPSKSSLRLSSLSSLPTTTWWQLACIAGDKQIMGEGKCHFCFEPQILIQLMTKFGLRWER